MRRRCWRGARSGCGAGTGGPSVGSGRGAGRGSGPYKAEECAAAGRGGAMAARPYLAATHGPGGGVFPGEPPSLRGPSPWWAGGGVGGELGGLDSPGKGVCLGRSFLSSEAAGPPGGPPAFRPHPHHSPRARAPAYSPGRASFHQAKYGFFPLPEKSPARVDLLYSQVPAGGGGGGAAQGPWAKSLAKCPHLQKGSVVVRISGQEDPWRPWGTSESWDRGTPGASLPVGLHPQIPLLLA